MKGFQVIEGGRVWCPQCDALLEATGYEHELVCPNCGRLFEGDQPDKLGEQPARRSEK